MVEKLVVKKDVGYNWLRYCNLTYKELLNG